MKKQNKLHLKKILYCSRLAAMVIFLCFLLFLFPNILKSSWQGILFFSLSIILVIFSLWSMLLKVQDSKEKISYNLLYIGFVGYLALIGSRLFFDSRVKLTLIYELDMNYFKINYLILSFVCLGIIFYTLLFIVEGKKKV